MGKPKSHKPPPPPDPIATPIKSGESEEQYQKRIASRQGFQRTVLTGGLAPKTGSTTTLGV